MALACACGAILRGRQSPSEQETAMARKAAAPASRSQAGTRPAPARRHRSRQDHRGLHGAARRETLRGDRLRRNRRALRTDACELPRRVRLDARDPTRRTSRSSIARCWPARAATWPRSRRASGCSMCLMRRIEVMAPYREATRSLLKSVSCNPGLAFALNGLAVRSQTLDADRRRHRRGGTARRDPRAGACGAVRPSAAHLGRR